MRVLFCLVWMMILTSCQTPAYTKADYVEDTKALFQMEHLSLLEESEEPLTYQEMVPVLLMIVDETDENYLIRLGCFTSDTIHSQQVVSKEKAATINQLVYEDVMNRSYIHTTFEVDEYFSIQEDEDLGAFGEGLYEQNGTFYKVDESGNVEETVPDSIEIEASFQPYLEDSIILPEGTSMSPSSLSYQEDQTISFLKSRYFNFKIKSYQVSGRVDDHSIQVKVKQKKENGMVIENDLTLSDLNCTLDYSLEDKRYYFRVDYQLKDAFSISKDKTVKQNKLQFDSFKQLQERLNQLTKTSEVEDELHLLTFQFEVPQTGNLVTVTMDLSLKMMASGEVAVTFQSSHQQGSKTYQDGLGYFNEQEWKVTPSIEGSLEVAAQLDFDLKLGKTRLADLAILGGVGASGKTKVHYVNEQNEVESLETLLDLNLVEDLLADEDATKQSYVQCCGDIEIYYFVRLKANQKTSLLRNLGIYGSITPLKNTLSLLHMENHQVLEKCTMEDFVVKEQENLDSFDISCYQKYLEVKESFQLTASEKDCIFESTHPRIVSVDQDGNVKAKKIGKAWITVKNKKGQMRQCLVIVREGQEIS